MPNLVWYCIKVAGNKYEMVKVNVVFVFGTEKVRHWVDGGWWVGCFCLRTVALCNTFEKRGTCRTLTVSGQRLGGHGHS